MSTLDGTPVIFDLDGTLVDSEPNYFEAGRRTLAGQGVTDFARADLLVRGGQAEFTARAAYDW